MIEMLYEEKREKRPQLFCLSNLPAPYTTPTEPLPKKFKKKLEINYIQKQTSHRLTNILN